MRLSINKNLPNWLRQLRQQYGWSQEELALKAGLHQSDISDFERGLQPSKKQYAKLVKALKLVEVESGKAA